MFLLHPILFVFACLSVCLCVCLSGLKGLTLSCFPVYVLSVCNLVVVEGFLARDVVCIFNHFASVFLSATGFIFCVCFLESLKLIQR